MLRYAEEFARQGGTGLKTVVTLGESLIDMVSQNTGNLEQATGFTKAAGGAPANVAACVAKLGGKSAFVGKRGVDPFGDFLHSTLTGCGVDTSYFTPTQAAKTALAFVALDAQGDRTFTFYRDPSADMLLTPQDVPHDFIASAGILHVGSVSLSSEPCAEATIGAVVKARSNGVFVSYDPNWRPPLWPDAMAGIMKAKNLLTECDMVKLNREELALFCETDDVRVGADFLHDLGVQAVFITLDAEGCFYSVRPNDARVPSQGRVAGRRVDVVDTTGAGDTFVGAILHELALAPSLSNDPREVLASLSANTLENMVEFAVAASALVTTRRGSIPALPTMEQVVRFMKDGRLDA